MEPEKLQPQVSDPVIRSLGRLLQFVGLFGLPMAILLQLQEQLSLGQMLVMAVAGLAAFWLGRIIEGYALQ